MEIYKLDSIEDGVAAIESPDKMMLYIKAEKLPENAKEGDCFTLEGEGFVMVKNETNLRKNEISSLIDSIITKN